MRISVASVCPRQGSTMSIATLANGSDNIVGRGMSGTLQLGSLAALWNSGKDAHATLTSLSKPGE